MFKITLMFYSALMASMAGADVITAKSMSVKIGSSEGSVKNMAVNGDGKAVALYTNRTGKLDMIFKFSVNKMASSLGLSANIKQHRAADTFVFQALTTDGSYVNIGSTGSGVNTRALQLTLPANAINNGSVTLRLLGDRGADDLSVDYLALFDQGMTTPTPPVVTVPPPIAPAPAVVTVPPVVTPPISGMSLTPGVNWYWQLQGSINIARTSEVYDIDLYDVSAATFASLKQSGHKVICYFSAGTYEDWRSDANMFPAASLGSEVDGWPGEKWIDVRNTTVRQIMAARLDQAKSKGCDGVEPDNVDGYSNGNGLGLTKQDQISFNSYLADQAHARGLVIALKNSTDLVDSLVSKFDFAVVEECFKYNECEAYSPFVKQNKAVLNAEYTKFSSATCDKAKQLGFSTVFYNLDLNGKVFDPCL